MGWSFSSLPPLLLLLWKELATLHTGTAKAMGEVGIYTQPCDGGTSSCGMSSWSKQPYCPSVACLFLYCAASLCSTALSHMSPPAISFPVLTLPPSQHHPQGWGSSGSRYKWGKAMSGPHAVEAKPLGISRALQGIPT